jgi:hypothetical protein
MVFADGTAGGWPRYPENTASGYTPTLQGGISI